MGIICELAITRHVCVGIICALAVARHVCMGAMCLGCYETRVSLYVY